MRRGLTAIAAVAVVAAMTPLPAAASRDKVHVVAATPAQAASRPTFYEVTVVTPPGPYEARATGTNSNGQVTITADTGGNNAYPFVYSAGNWIAINPVLSCPDPDFPDQDFCPDASAVGINGSGQIVGTAGNFRTSHAYRYDLGTGIAHELGTLGGDSSWGYGINGSGQIVGGSLIGDGRQRAFLWDGSTMRGLGTLGGPTSVAYASSSTGQAVGCADKAGGAQHPFLYQGGAMHDLGVPAGWSQGCAATINAVGVVGGTSVRSAPTAIRCVGWLRSPAGFTLLPVPGGADCVDVRHLNNVGEAVGSYSLASGADSFGFVYSAGVLRRLDNRIPFDRRFHITDATGNNLQGLIVGESSDPRGTAAVVLTPITILDETNGRIAFNGSWSRVAAGGAFGGHVMVSSSAGATATVTFTGRGISIIGPTGPNLGTADLFLDGQNAPPYQISEQSDRVHSRTRVYRTSFKRSGTHTVQISLLGDAPFRLDAITITP
jgi:probable HAF family extracellular repeat protein